jgi:predicted DNA-binding ribbon-helix-helix protein
MSAREMHQTTLRFDRALWRGLSAAAARRKMSIAQYVRYAV